ncbi:MAG: phosphate ABC transporter permease subunit PstC [Porphyromonadaceae bacterium]|nr:MAG: phosphate ABC transporter permease subunit PstC [Porphyromonadaceae bacterium]
MKSVRRIIEKITHGVLFTSSMVTSVTVLLVVLFLFREGIGLFNQTAIEGHLAVVVNSSNPLNQLTSKQVKDIFNQDITNWKDIAGTDGEIIPKSIDDLAGQFTEEELGTDFKNLPDLIEQFVQANPGVIAYFPDTYLKKDFKGKLIPLKKVSVKEFIIGHEWYPTSQPAAVYGALPLILGTLWVSLGAILLALPIGLITAIYMAEVAGQRFRNILKPVVELLSGIPSVVYGFFGLVVLVPLIQKFFKLDVGETALAGSIILAIMSLPTIITIAEDAIRTTPRALKEASLALGASHWQTLVRVTIPFAKSGIIAAVILGIGRAVGETMAVLMVTGNASVIPHTFLEPVRTIPATIAAELGEASFGGTHFKALFALGIILFIMTFIFNTLVETVKTRKI